MSDDIPYSSTALNAIDLLWSIEFVIFTQFSPLSVSYSYFWEFCREQDIHMKQNKTRHCLERIAWPCDPLYLGDSNTVSYIKNSDFGEWNANMPYLILFPH